MSHPTWVRGLKQYRRKSLEEGNCVAPYVGAWIETVLTYYHSKDQEVAPYVGAWIETPDPSPDPSPDPVAPYVGAWIETVLTYYHSKDQEVAPYVGAWIETRCRHCSWVARSGRTLRGCVD